MTEQSNPDRGMRFLVIAAALVIIIEERSIVRPKKSLRRIDRENAQGQYRPLCKIQPVPFDKKNLSNAGFARQGGKVCQF
jgi:hypothetical protein